LLVATWVDHSCTNIASPLQLTLTILPRQTMHPQFNILPSGGIPILLCESSDRTDIWDPKTSQKQLETYSPHKQNNNFQLISRAKTNVILL
jgi:hypothetical protein